MGKSDQNIIDEITEAKSEDSEFLANGKLIPLKDGIGLFQQTIDFLLQQSISTEEDILH